ncbi:MAG: 4Fe-4S dicluster domain-containing protein [Chloroflexota bacterium]
MTIMPDLDSELCNGCGLCLVVCHGGGITEYGDKVRISETPNCDYCSICEAVCPQGAIRCGYIIVSGEEQQ